MAKGRFWSDCTNAQADPNLRLARMSECTCPDVAWHTFPDVKNVIYIFYWICLSPLLSCKVVGIYAPSTEVTLSKSFGLPSEKGSTLFPFSVGPFSECDNEQQKKKQQKVTKVFYLVQHDEIFKSSSSPLKGYQMTSVWWDYNTTAARVNPFVFFTAWK